MAEPSEPLGLTVHSLPQPGAALANQRRSGRWKMLAVLAVCAAPVLISYYMYYFARPAGGATAYGTLIQPVRPAPAVVGRTLDGQPQPLRALAGQWLLVVVGGGGCAPDAACEKRLFMQRQLREMTGKERDRIEKLWLVVDDAPVAPRLASALQSVPGMNIVRLPREQVAAWLQPAEGRALEDHLYIVDPQGDWMMRQPADADPSKVKRDIEKLLRGSAGWDQPGRQPLIEAAGAGPAGAAPAAVSRP